MSSTDNWAYTIVLTLDEQAHDNPIDTNRALCLIAGLKPAHIYVFTNYRDTFALCAMPFVVTILELFIEEMEIA